MKKKPERKVGKINYNPDPDVPKDIDQAYQYIDDITDEKYLKEECKKADFSGAINDYSKPNCRKAIFYWLDKCVEHKYISDVEAIFIKLMFNGTSKVFLLKTMKPHFISINTLKDIDICENNIISKIEHGIGEIRSKFIPILDDSESHNSKSKILVNQNGNR